MYLLDNAAREATDRFDALAAVFDAGTERHITALGIAPGWTCLEIGAGGGSIARWLAHAVAPDGSVLATDIDPRHVSTAGISNLRVQRHDAGVDSLPSSAFDLVHARLVLMHIEDDAAALQRMIEALKPGGWLLVEDFSLPSASAHAALPSLLAIRRLMAGAGVDIDGGHTLASRFRASGLENVDTEARAYMWYGRSAGSKVFRANIEQLRPAIEHDGLVSPAEVTADLARLDDPHFALHSPVMWAAWGRRPASRPRVAPAPTQLMYQPPFTLIV
jgi:SAM-dependent methyltransferase